MSKTQTTTSQTLIEKHETMLTLLVYFSSYPIIYLVNIMLSRALGPINYGDFAVTRSVAILAATIALLGMDKATLTFLPIYRKQGATGAAKGFVSFALLAILATGITVSLVGTGVVILFKSRVPNIEHPVMISMVWVVPMSVGFYFVSMLASHQQVLLASLLSRIVLPLSVTALLGIVLELDIR